MPTANVRLALSMSPLLGMIPPQLGMTPLGSQVCEADGKDARLAQASRRACSTTDSSSSGDAGSTPTGSEIGSCSVGSRS